MADHDKSINFHKNKNSMLCIPVEREVFHKTLLQRTKFKKIYIQKLGPLAQTFLREVDFLCIARNQQCLK